MTSSRGWNWAFEHETQHQELLLMDVKYNFFINPLKPAYRDAANLPSSASLPAMGWTEFAGGIIEIGHDGVGFSFDNERPRHQTLLQDFRLGNRLVSNEEYLAFITDGGYQRADLWLSDGWHTINAQHWQAPLYWYRDGSGWQQFTLSGMQPLNLSEPVAHLSYYEADAYARWANKRLPTEAELGTRGRKLADRRQFSRIRSAASTSCTPARAHPTVW